MGGTVSLQSYIKAGRSSIKGFHGCSKKMQLLLKNFPTVEIQCLVKFHSFATCFFHIASSLILSLSGLKRADPR